MKRSLITGSLIAVLVALVCVSLTGTAFSQGPIYDPSARAMYKALPPHSYFPTTQNNDPAVQLPQWTFTWTSSYNNRNYSTVIVGADPRSSDATTTVTVGIIPIKMVYGASNGNMTFDPNSLYYKNYTTTQMVNLSPIFQSEFDYTQGGTDLGKTQYEDAYQRGDFWGAVKTNTKYHLLLKTVIGPEQTFTVPAGTGSVISNPWSGIPTGTADINWFDEQLQVVLNKYKSQITPNVLPLFITENVYLTEGGCCIGGYHSANGGAPGGQTYSYSTSIQQAGVPVFSQDVGALAHEVGEWIMDPFTENSSPCPSNGILEVGDPLENQNNFGDYPYSIKGFTFHPQDLVFITWFGAPAATSLDVWNGTQKDVTTFQNENAGVCQTL
ncbi:MAG: hypothetical protein WAL32_09965 [Terriglobales bacterium]